ncbi:methyltransferase [bacterium]|nr:methyltransferase [bacterium]
MKKHITPQNLFIHTLLANTIEKKDDFLLFSLYDEQTNQLAVAFERNKKDFRQIHPTDESTLADETVLSRVEEYLEKPNFFLTINDGTQVETIRVEKGKVKRSSEPRQNQILKTAEWAVGKTTHLDPNTAAPLLQAIGLMTPDGEIKAPLRKKFKQVNHFLEQVSPLLKQTSTKKPFTVIDCGCGKTYLGFVLYWYIRKVLKLKARFYGIDVDEKLIHQSRQRAEQLHLPNMHFECNAILQGDIPQSPDLLVSLHACDTATDEALAAGVAAKAKHIIAVPCCQKEISNQIQEIPGYPLAKKHGIFAHRFGDLLTDMLRSLFLEAQGYTVTAGEFVSPIETPKNLMIRASRGNHHQDYRREEYKVFKHLYKISPSIDLFLLEREASAIYQ